jgi:bifunctional DNA-binding transcriptional regulator/antitoxin component of YhaV-PrlF toxin-antitoxin module
MRLTSKRQVTVPADLCRAKGLRPHDEVEWAEHQDGLLLRKPKSRATGPDLIQQMQQGGPIAGTTEEKLRFTRGDQ